jgi:hypothetical protein
MQKGKWLGGVAQGVGPKFKPQYFKKKKEKKERPALYVQNKKDHQLVSTGKAKDKLRTDCISLQNVLVCMSYFSL